MKNSKMTLLIIGALTLIPSIHCMDINEPVIMIKTGMVTVDGQALIATRIDGTLTINSHHIEIAVRRNTHTSSFNLTRENDTATLAPRSSALINGKRYAAGNQPKTIILENGKIKVKENQ